MSPVTRKPRSWLFCRSTAVSSVMVFEWIDWARLFPAVVDPIMLMFMKKMNITIAADAQITANDRPSVRGIFID